MLTAYCSLSTLYSFTAMYDKIFLNDDHVIITRDLTKVYKGSWRRQKVLALNKLNLDVKKGEIFGLLGPNGSGKTTTIKLLLGLIFPTSGTVHILNKPSTDVNIKNKIGFLPEETYLYKFLNAEETLDFYGQLFKIPKDTRKKRIDCLIKEVGLEGAKKRPLKEYSKGMLRRIGLAQALINDPELFILDEPTSGLDPIGTREIKDKILDMKRRGKTVFMCSHLLADVQDICDRVAILNNGNLQIIGSVKELVSNTDIVEILAKNLSKEVLEEIRGFITQKRGEVISIDHPTTTLEELFIKVVQFSNKRNN